MDGETTGHQPASPSIESVAPQRFVHSAWVKTAPSHPASAVDKIVYNSQWKGPLVGAEIPEYSGTNGKAQEGQITTAQG